MLALRVMLHADTEILIDAGAGGLARVSLTPIVRSWYVRDNVAAVFTTNADLPMHSEDLDHEKCSIRLRQTVEKPARSLIQVEELGRAAASSYLSGDEDPVVSVIARIVETRGGCSTEVTFEDMSASLTIDGWDAPMNEELGCIMIPFPETLDITFLGSSTAKRGSNLQFVLESDDSGFVITSHDPKIENGDIQQRFTISATRSSSIIYELTLRLIDTSTAQQIERRLNVCAFQQHSPVAQDTFVTITRQELTSQGGYVLLGFQADDPDLPGDNNHCEVYFQLEDNSFKGQLFDAAGQKTTLVIGSFFNSTQVTGSMKWYPGLDIPPGEYVFRYQAGEMDRVVPIGDACGRECETWSSATCTVQVLNTLPVAYAKSFDNDSGTQILAVIKGNVLCKGSVADFDFDGDDLTVELVPGSGPLVGTLDLNADGSFTYYIDTRKAETTSFEYEVFDGRGGSDTATVTLEVYTPSGNPPSLSVSTLPNVSCSAAEGGAGECQNFRISITDPDLSIPWFGESLTLSVSIAGAGNTFYTLLGFNDGGAITDPGQASGTLQIRPDRSFSSVNVRVHVKDSTGFEDVTTIVVSPENETPQFFHANQWTSFGSASASGSCASIGPSVFTMDPAWYEAGCLQFRDLDGDVLTFRLSQMPRFGTVNLLTAGLPGQRQSACF